MEQTFITGLTIGLFLGWLVEFLIDLFYWRRGNSATGLAIKQLQDANLTLATASQHVSSLSEEMVALSTNNSALNAKLANLRHENENLRAQLARIAARHVREAYQHDNVGNSAEIPNDNIADEFKTAASQIERQSNLDAFKTAASEFSA